ncbi:MAG TPA: adenosylcobinamide-GDP ribazoletransferase [Candidatus Methanofastidiosa archaeon]|nr:adenosylcobinamide-GDP ribazoletransferase [Candidatus Methanofastidiosa archaeon]
MNGPKDYAKLPIVAIQFLTRIPLYPNMAVDSVDLGRCLAFFPFVGALIASAAVGLAYVALELELPLGVIAALILLMEALITGAFHWDGLADTFDGFYSTHKTREEMLDIMHDSRIGVMGALAVVLVALLQYSCLGGMLALRDYQWGIFSAYMFGKWGCVYLSVASAYGRKEGKGLVFLANARWPTLFVATIFLLPLLWIDQKNIVIFICVMAFNALWGKYSERKVGGVTGDVLGASARLSETLTMLLFLILY